MKKVINGKSYNTETADKVASWSNDYSTSDFNWCEESLYKTKKGQWFIAGEGGAMSKYSKPCSNNSQCGGDGLELLTPDEAKSWLEDRDEIDILEAHFAIEEG